MRHRGVDMAAEQRGARLAPARERHVRCLEAAGDLPPLERQMADRSLAGRANAKLAGIRLGRGHELLHGLPRRVHLHGEKRVEGDRVQEGLVVVRGLVRQLVDLGMDHQSRVRRHDDGVAVGLRLRDFRHPHGTAATGPVEDGHALRERLLHRLGHGADDDVHHAAGRVGHDNRQRPLRILGGRGRHESEEQDGKKRETKHECPPFRIRSRPAQYLTMPSRVWET